MLTTYFVLQLRLERTAVLLQLCHTAAVAGAVLLLQRYQLLLTLRRRLSQRPDLRPRRSQLLLELLVLSLQPLGDGVHLRQRLELVVGVLQLRTELPHLHASAAHRCIRHARCVIV